MICGPPCLGQLHVRYTAQLSRGKTFAVEHITHYSLENFCGASGQGHCVLYMASDSKGKLWRLAKIPQKIPPQKLPYMVVHYAIIWLFCLPPNLNNAIYKYLNSYSI